MHLFLAWREMEDRIGTLGHIIERVLWGDSRARHTFLIACSDDHPLLLIEIDIGDEEKGIRKSMKLNIVDCHELPASLSKLVFIGEISSPTAIDRLLRSADTYVQEHPNYNALRNNCRTFVEYLIDQFPEFRNSIPRKNGSILEHYHSEAKHDHPGALQKSKQFLREVRDLHRSNRQYAYASRLVLSPKLVPDQDVESNGNNFLQRE